MLHEEVELKWEELQCIIEDFQTLENLRSALVVGGSTMFVGSRPRTREVLQRKMYTHEINWWLMEAKLEERRPAPGATRDNAEDGSGDAYTGDTDHLMLNGNLRNQASNSTSTR